MRIGMRLLMGYFLIVAIAAWFVLSIFVQEALVQENQDCLLRIHVLAAFLGYTI